MTDPQGANEGQRNALRLTEGKDQGNGLGSGHPQPLSQAEGKGGIGDPRQQSAQFFRGEGLPPPASEPLAQSSFLMGLKKVRGRGDSESH
jgi:hypothetical protein